jgi:hypothetical protein
MRISMENEKDPLPALECGTRLIVRGPESEEDRTAIVVQLKNGLIWISRFETPGEAGERVVIERPIDGDACYAAPARVEFVPPETYALRRVGEWQRRQRRADVRVSTKGLDLTVIRPDGDSQPDGEKVPVADISAGGVCVGSVAGLEAGDEVRCIFELPGEQRFDLRARVVRRGGTGQSGRVAFQFLDVDDEHHSALLRWVYREQARRHRDRKNRRGRP